MALEDLPLSPAIGAINEALLAYAIATGSPGHVAAWQWHHANRLKQAWLKHLLIRPCCRRQAYQYQYYHISLSLCQP